MEKGTLAIDVYIGGKVFELRSNKDMTQTELASKVGLSRASIVNIESGRCGSTLDRLYKIAEVLNSSINDIIPDDDWVKEYGDKVVVKKVTYQIIEKNTDLNPYSHTANWIKV